MTHHARPDPRARDVRRPRLLMLNLYMVHPPNSGAKVVIRNRIVELSKSFDVTFCCLGESPDDDTAADALRAFAEVVVARPDRRVRGRFERLRGLVADPCALPFADALDAWLGSAETAELARRSFDLVEVQSACWEHRRLADFGGLRVLVAMNDEREYYVGRARATWRTQGLFAGARAGIDALLVSLQERRAIHRCDALVSLAPSSAVARRAHAQGRPVLANWGGIDLEAHAPGSSPAAATIPGARPPILLFVAALFVENAHEAAERFVLDALPGVLAAHPSATFVLVGDPRGHPVIRRLGEHPNVVVTGLVPDVRPYLATADLVVVPIVHGSGVRYKIMEAMAAGKVVVSTEKGAEGLGVTDGVNAVLVPSVAAMAEAVVEMLDDGERRRLLAAAAREEARRRFDRVEEHRRLAEWYRELIGA